MSTPARCTSCSRTQYHYAECARVECPNRKPVTAAPAGYALGNAHYVARTPSLAETRPQGDIE